MTKDIQNIKLELIQWLAGLQDPVQVLKIMDAKKQLEKEYEEAFKPMSKVQLIARAKESFKDYENGDLIDVEVLAKKYL